MPEFVTIQEFLNVNDAVVARSVLEGHDIRTWLANENSVLMPTHYGFFKGSGVRLQVEAADEARARDILEGTDFDTLQDDGGRPEADTMEGELPEAPEGKETVQVLQTGEEASLVRGFLQAQGFDATVQSPKTGWVRGVNMAGGFMVNVPAADAEEARQVLASLDTADLDYAGYDDVEDAVETTAAPIPQVCPNCGSAQIHAARIPEWLRLLGIVLLLGLPLIFGKRTSWICADCDWEWTP